MSDDSGIVIPDGFVGTKEPNEDHGGVFTETKGVKHQVFVPSTFFFGIKEWKNVNGTKDKAKQNFLTLKKKVKLLKYQNQDWKFQSTARDKLKLKSI